MFAVQFVLVAYIGGNPGWITPYLLSCPPNALKKFTIYSYPRKRYTLCLYTYNIYRGVDSLCVYGAIADSGINSDRPVMEDIHKKVFFLVVEPLRSG